MVRRGAGGRQWFQLGRRPFDPPEARPPRGQGARGHGVRPSGPRVDVAVRPHVADREERGRAVGGLAPTVSGSICVFVPGDLCRKCEPGVAGTHAVGRCTSGGGPASMPLGARLPFPFSLERVCTQKRASAVRAHAARRRDSCGALRSLPQVCLKSPGLPALAHTRSFEFAHPSCARLRHLCKTERVGCPRARG